MTYYNRKRGELMEEISKGTFNVALTSDVWSTRTRENYISVVVHFVDEELILQKCIIDF